jgi:beta-mannosidase
MQSWLAFPLFCAVMTAGAFPSQEASMSVQTFDIDRNWRFREATAQEWHPASVPGSVHTDLMSNKLIPDPFFGTNEQQLQWIGEKDWVYETAFDLPEDLLGRENIEIVFKGLDTYATVTLNDALLLTADNMFREWRRECKTVLRQKGNRLSIRFRNVFDENLPKYRRAPFPLQAFGNNDQSDVKIAMYSRKAQFHYGWDWGPRLITCGVWRRVVIEGWDAIRIQGARIVQERVSSSAADIASVVDIRSSSNQAVRVELSADGVTLGAKDAGLQKGLNTVTVRGTIANPKLWWTNGLGGHYLYDVRVRAISRDGHRDESGSKIGVRSLEIVREKDSLGTSLYVRLNGVPVFMKGANYIPQDNFQNRVTPERFETTIKAAAQANMNMLRLWGGGIYEDDLFYDACDREGILVWHDLMFACAMYPGDDAFLENVKQEILDNVRRIRNHTCIALYCGNNENEISWYAWGWKQLYPPETQEAYERDLRRLFYSVIPEALKEADPTRYYHHSSPITGFRNLSPMDGDTHYWGVWHGKEPFEQYENHIARFVSEYGFQSYPQLSSVMKFADPKDRELHSPVMLSHQRCMAEERRDKEYGNRLIATYMEKVLRMPKDFPSYLYASQVLQAEGVRMAIEAHRRNMPACMGSLYWQIDDCWPVASWSSIDYYGEWKALHYYAKRLYEPVIIVPRIGEKEITLSLVSDKLEALAGELRVRTISLDGREVYANTIRVSVKPNTSAVYAGLRRSDVVGREDTSALAMVSTFTSGGIVIAANVSYFSAPKDLALKRPEIRIESRKLTGGYEILLVSNTLAKNVVLSCEGCRGFFSDNYFDLLPNEPKFVMVPTQQEEGNFQRLLKVMSLFDSYE